eukprot:CAMPEP_0175004960 /NCGR_PEP_ID=MMETSP0005-20121125/5047_1 /TAXON_ID=420556 /ORGANISM="Ochromonas sp., Strain CCMP1393" /LENGTH=305 /DNA_ID=CAMNT_0016260151 /DNA_START=138 /DNA_END=1052 /DNA_ORIENTATION=-
MPGSSYSSIELSICALHFSFFNLVPLEQVPEASSEIVEQDALLVALEYIETPTAGSSGSHKKKTYNMYEQQQQNHHKPSQQPSNKYRRIDTHEGARLPSGSGSSGDSNGGTTGGTTGGTNATNDDEANGDAATAHPPTPPPTPTGSNTTATTIEAAAATVAHGDGEENVEDGANGETRNEEDIDDTTSTPVEAAAPTAAAPMSQEKVEIKEKFDRLQILRQQAEEILKKKETILKTQLDKCRAMIDELEQSEECEAKHSILPNLEGKILDLQTQLRAVREQIEKGPAVGESAGATLSSSSAAGAA